MAQADKPVSLMRGATTGNPVMNRALTFKEMGTPGLRQYSGWVREEFLPQLQGRRAATVYREMADNSATIGALIFSIVQALRQVEWRVVTPNDSAAAKREQEFVEGMMTDMSHTWDDFNVERLSMLTFGFAPHEIIYKRRNGYQPENGPTPSSMFDDGRIGIRRLPIRAQDTVLKWYFDGDGGILGLQQQPYVGPIVSIPIQKMLLYRPKSHKNNPEGISILRTAYRAYYFQKRMEEQEAILFERMSGLPVVSVPNDLLVAAAKGDKDASQTLETYRQIVTNVRIDEQMGMVIPSDVWTDDEGKPSTVRQYEFKLETPTGSKGPVDPSKAIDRYKTDILMSVLADFLLLGHVQRGTNNLGVTKVDMFYQAIEGWLTSVSEVDNRYLIPRVWALNGLPRDTMPRIEPIMPRRLDLDSLGTYITALANAGVSLFPDQNAENYLREAGGLPEIDNPDEFQALVEANKINPETGTPNGAVPVGNKAAKGPARAAIKTRTGKPKNAAPNPQDVVRNPR